jgi:hypothetical protein
MGATVFLGCAGMALYWFKQGNKPAILLCFALTTLVGGQIAMVGHRSYGSQHTGYFMAQQLKPYLQAQTPVYIVGFYDQSLPFYLQRTLTLVDYEDEFATGFKMEPEKKITLSQFQQQWRNQPGAIAIFTPSTFDDKMNKDESMRVIARDDNRIAIMSP